MHLHFYQYSVSGDHDFENNYNNNKITYNQEGEICKTGKLERSSRTEN